METFECPENFNALITEKTCKARVKSLLFPPDNKKRRGYTFAVLGPADKGNKCSSCDRGVKIIKEFEQKGKK